MKLTAEDRMEIYDYCEWMGFLSSMSKEDLSFDKDWKKFKELKKVLDFTKCENFEEVKNNFEVIINNKNEIIIKTN